MVLSLLDEQPWWAPLPCTLLPQGYSYLLMLSHLPGLFLPQTVGLLEFNVLEVWGPPDLPLILLVLPTRHPKCSLNLSTLQLDLQLEHSHGFPESTWLSQGRHVPALKPSVGPYCS